MSNSSKSIGFSLRGGQVFGAGFLTLLTLGGAAACTAPGDDQRLAQGDLPDEIVPACALDRTAFRIDDVRFDHTNPAARIDLDGDGRPDDVGGAIREMFEGNFAQETMNTWDGHVRARLSAEPWLVVIERCSDSDRAFVRLARASDPDGDGAFRLIGTSVRAAGHADADGVYTRDGAGEAPMRALFAPLGDVDGGWTVGVGLATQQLRVGSDGRLDGFVALAFAPEVEDAVAPGMAAFFTKKAGDGDSAMAELLDVNSDGVVTEAEFLGHQLIKALLAPDVDLYDERGDARVYAPNEDQVSDAISVTLRVGAAPVALED